LPTANEEATMARVDPYGTIGDLHLEPELRGQLPTKKEEPKPAKKEEVRPAAVKAPAPPPAAPAPAPVKAEKPLERNAGEVCKRFPLSEEARKLLTPDLTAGAFLQVLQKQQLYVDAVRLLAHGLPRRDAVGWACACTRAVLPKPTLQAAGALQSAEKWCADPSEPNRRDAEAAAEAAGLYTPAGCAAIAAFWSGGSLSPPNAPVVPPAQSLTAQAAANAVLMAAVHEPRKAPDRYGQFLAQGIQIAQSGQGNSTREVTDATRGSRR
jgi:hypothetical protein